MPPVLTKQKTQCKGGIDKLRRRKPARKFLWFFLFKERTIPSNLKERIIERFKSRYGAGRRHSRRPAARQIWLRRTRPRRARSATKRTNGRKTPAPDKQEKYRKTERQDSTTPVAVPSATSSAPRLRPRSPGVPTPKPDPPQARDTTYNYPAKRNPKRCPPLPATPPRPANRRTPPPSPPGNGTPRKTATAPYTLQIDIPPNVASTVKIEEIPDTGKPYARFPGKKETRGHNIRFSRQRRMKHNR